MPLPSAAHSSHFAGIATATTKERTRRLDPGKYTLEVSTLDFFLARDRAPCFQADFVVLESSNPDFQAGDVAGFFTKQGKFPEYFLVSIKRLLAAAAGASEDDVTEEDAEHAVSEEQPLRGHKLRCIVEPNPKNADFPNFRFMAYGE